MLGRVYFTYNQLTILGKILLSLRRLLMLLVDILTLVQSEYYFAVIYRFNTCLLLKIQR